MCFFYLLFQKFMSFTIEIYLNSKVISFSWNNEKEVICENFELILSLNNWIDVKFCQNKIWFSKLKKRKE